jgi:methyl-accepting chemotaxis protein
MLVGRLLDDKYVKKINPSIVGPLKIQLFENLQKDPANKNWVDKISKENPNYIRVVNDKVLNGFTLLSDLNGSPVCLIKMEVQRSIFLEGRSTVYIFIGLIVGIGWIGAFLMVWLNNKVIFQPLQKLKSIASEISKGNFKTKITTSQKDEIGDVYRSFHDLVSFLLNIAGASEKIAEGDLIVSVEPQSEEDTLSKSINQMVVKLKDKIAVFIESSNRIEKASEDLTHISTEANHSTAQITTTIQQVAQGITDQSTSVNKTATAVDQLSRAIEDVAYGTENQSKAVQHASIITSQITGTIQQVLNNIKEVAAESGKATITAHNGSTTVEDTLKGMQAIKKKMDLSSEKIHQMGTRSEQIAEIVEAIDEIASQTNLLALNAAIEAARAESQASQLVEIILNKQMTSQAVLIDHLFTDDNHRPDNFWPALAKKSGMDVISIVNDDGVNVLSSDPSLIGFRYSENPKEQSYVFRQLINRKDGIVCQPPRKRTIDGKMYKYIGISRSDGKGFIQLGFNADSLAGFQFQVGGFAVVASEVYRLAENARESAKNIAHLINEIRTSVTEAVKAMDESATEVDHGYLLADQSNIALGTILLATQAVSNQAEQAANAAQKMSSFTSDLVNSMTSVSSVVDLNVAATSQMTSNSNQVSEAVENFASVSEENSAAVEEVSASTEEMKAQVEMVSNAAIELRGMAKSLMDIGRSFKLD